MSRSLLIAERLKSRAAFRKTTGVLIILIMIAYLAWRLTIFSQDWTFSLLFYIGDVLSFILMVSMICSAWNYRHRTPQAPLPNQKVDVFLPIYKEPIEIIRKTVRAAQRIRYPHTTYVLDDGKNEAVRQLAEEVGAIYVCRADNQGAKAGNMNHALKQATGDYIFVFDADHIAQPEAIETLLCFFEDEKVGLVISPQDYYNLDGLQFMHHSSGRIWHDQSRFYNMSQSCKDSCNCATSCGTGVAYRRKVIDKLGGFPELTITEDMHTTLLIHKLGYHSVYVNESVAYGIAPADVADYYRTRERWAHGNLHVLAAEKPWNAKNLTFKQRLSYMELGVIYLECWQQFLIFLVPILSIFFAWQPFEITIFNVMLVLGVPLVLLIMQDEQGCGMSRNWTSQIFSIARMPVQMTSWSALFGRRIAWRASKKNLAGVFDWVLVSPQLVLTFVSLSALIFAIFKIPEIQHHGPITEMIVAMWNRLIGNTNDAVFQTDLLDVVLDRGYSWDLLIISSFWVIYNASRSGYWLIDAYQRTKHTHAHYRFQIPLIIEQASGELSETNWISESAISINQPNHRYVTGDEVSWMLWLPAGAIHVKGVVSHTFKQEVQATLHWEKQAEIDQLCDALYSVDWHAEIHQREGYFPTLLEKLADALWLKSDHRLLKWRAGLMDGGNGRDRCLVLLGCYEGESVSQILGFGTDLTGQRVSVILPGGKTSSYVIGNRLNLQGWCKIGLDGCVRWKSSIAEV